MGLKLGPGIDEDPRTAQWDCREGTSEELNEGQCRCEGPSAITPAPRPLYPASVFPMGVRIGLPMGFPKPRHGSQSFMAV